MNGSSRRAARAAVLAVAVLVVAAPGALGATLTNSAGTLTFTGAGDLVNDLELTQPGPATVRVVRFPGAAPDGDTDPIAAAGCAQNVAGSDYTCAGVTRIVVALNGGTDFLDGDAITLPFAQITGGAGNDQISAGEAADVVDAGDGDDAVRAGAGNDDLRGGSGGDLLLGNEGDDTLRGGDGNDLIVGVMGNDTERGESGDDGFVGTVGNDDVSGGPGTDTQFLGFFEDPRPSLRVSLDDAANDQTAVPADADNVHADVEGVLAEPPAILNILPSGGESVPKSANDTLTGNAGPNTLNGGFGDDTVDGLAGNDVLNGAEGNDTVRARDGFADFVNCGPGTDTAEVDTLDSVAECENVQRVDVGNANDVPEDAPPAIVLTGPGPSALLRTTGPTELTATATDDKGIAQVLFLDDDRIVCSDTAAPYTCVYQPRGEDVGRNTLVAVAVDTAQQTASTTRAFNVDRFNVGSITGAVTPARDTKAPFVFRTSGRLRLPVFVTPALGCRAGQVSIQVKAGSKTISTRRADLRRDCSFASTVRFADRRRFTRAGKLRFTLRFTGNEVLNRSAAVARNVRTRT